MKVRQHLFRKLGIPHLALAAVLALFAVLSLSACFEDRVAGGTDEVENPALTAVLRNDQNQAMPGTLRLYARYQNPSRDSMPVLSVPAGLTGAEVRAKTLLLAMDSASKAGVPWKNRDSVAFNLVGSTAEEESFAADYLLFKGSDGYWRFRRVIPYEGAGDGDQDLTTRLPMAPTVLDYHGSVGARGVELGLRKIFVPGSPYHADIATDGVFILPRLAPGRYDVKALDADGKVYGSLDPLHTDTPFAPEDWSEADIIWVGD